MSEKPVASKKESRLRALDVKAGAASFDGKGGDVLLVLTPDSYVKALTPNQAKIAWEAGKLIGWKPLVGADIQQASDE